MPLNLNGKKYTNKNYPLIVGILNLTPDSFSDGGKHNTEYKALKRVESMIEDGADIIDIGAESSRPDSKRISFDEEKKRLLPITKKIIKRFDIPISIDTMKSQIADITLKEGASIINDVTGFLYDEKMPDVIGKNKGAVIINHTSDLPQNMQKKTSYKNMFNEIKNFFEEKIKICINNNIKKNSIIIDPGIGFGKKTAQNVDLIKNIKIFQKFKLPIMYGVSNKRFLGELLDINNPIERTNATIITCLFLTINNVNLLRVHDIKKTQEMIKLWRLYQ